MRRWEGVIYLVLALIGGEYIALRGLLTVPKSLTSWALTNVFSTSNAPVPQQVFQYALHAVQPLCRPGYVGCEWDTYVAAHAMASAVWGIIITMVMLAMTYIAAILLTASYRRRLGVGRLSFIALDVLAPLALLLVGYLTCLYALQPGNFILTLTIETWRGNASGIMGIPMLLGVIAIAIVIATLT
ncbi:MAG: hypothetical protein RXO26_06890 [Caldivirga sp.]|jgi:hypothetical protein|uniref:hypothetical protein n=1 Tax=Caldivirga sp. MU80 TaxID=1650354 RepID=UPI000835B533|nr:hypothetical protein [Caldivirga sp. MU80]